MDPTTIRSHFPALSKEQVFFDNAGGSQVLASVVDSIRDYLVNSNVQVGATYAAGRRATTSYENAYQAAAKYINASRDDIVLGASTTQLFRNVSATLTFQPGDELVLSAIDHEANIAPWVDLADRQQLTIKWWKPALRNEPKLHASDLETLLSDRTRLVTCTHASNILGTIHDIKAISTAVHAAAPDALVCADAVAYAPHRKVDVKHLGVDLYAFSWYKVYGPHIAMLYASSERAQKQMRSLGHFFNPHATLENKLGLAGASYELMSGIPAVTEYLQSVGWDTIMAQEAALQEELLGSLNRRPDVEIHGERSADGTARVPTVSFTVKGWDSCELVKALENESPFALRWGSFHSNRLVDEVLNLEKSGVVRVSMVHYNTGEYNPRQNKLDYAGVLTSSRTVEEVKALIAALDKALSQKN